MCRVWIGCLAVLSLVGEQADLSPERREQNRAAFKIVWETIRDKHWDPRPNGLDWEAVRAEFAPKIEQAKTQEECRQVLQDMLGRLEQSHFGIVPGDIYEALEQEEGATDNPGRRNQPKRSGRMGEGQPGFDVRVIKGQALVTQVDPEGPAAKAGVKTGWIVEAIDGEEVEPVIQKIIEGKHSLHHREFLLIRAVRGRLGGFVGDQVSVRFRDGEDQVQEKTLSLVAPKGKLARFGNLPPMHVRCEVRTLADNIGYVYLSTFFDPPNVMPRFIQAVRDHRHAPGFILDLRGNPGGIGFMAVGIGGWFVKDANLRLGTMITRDSKVNFVLNPQEEPYLGPLAVLVDAASASTSEILAGGLKDIGRARIFGTRTAGAALPSIITRLPNGDGFQYAFANYISAGGKPLEGIGVIPDVEIVPERAELLAGKDPVLEAAVRWIRQQPAVKP
jgi:carboxyl-terminal processing protease